MFEWSRSYDHYLKSREVMDFWSDLRNGSFAKIYKEGPETFVFDDERYL